MKTVVLVGPPGAGKSTVGARLAASLGVPFVDTDDLVAKRASAPSAADVLRREGEPAFRAHEAAALRELFADQSAAPRVVATGGGTLVDRRLRHFVLDRALLVGLDARIGTLEARLAGGPDRPLLSGPDGSDLALQRLVELRRAAYAEAHVTIATDDLDPDSVVDAIVPWTTRDLVAMPLGERSYAIELVRNDPTRVVDRLASLGPSAVVLVTDARIRRAQKKLLATMLEPLTVPLVEVVLAPGEGQKTAASVAAVWDAALGAGIDRDAVVFGFGGGVVLDLAGFAASTLLRGIRWMSAPTTTLSMLDASVGGKTGFDHAAGKNLIGAFHQPSAVVAELTTLQTLPERERRAGLAEAVKIGLTSDRALFERMEATADALARGDEAALEPVLRAAIEAKARVVRDDERERGDRVILNFGHTVGHALEAHGSYARWLHGEAVALGILAEIAAGRALGHTPADLGIRTASLLGKLGLPFAVAPAELAASLPWIASDKKRRRAGLRLPVVTGMGESRVVELPLAQLTSALT